MAGRASSDDPYTNNTSSQPLSSTRSAESQRITAFRIKSYLADPETSVPFATTVNTTRSGGHKQLNKVAVAGYRMGTFLKEFDEIFDGDAAQDSGDRNYASKERTTTSS
ncbi:ecee6abb-f040-47fb-9009-fcd4558b0989 [Sclerotinia trifoliorum]|uniref:Ecee6abb-f040-47fb-9009-fcd4558b0989 n=1 Tax=Sclerotinia trifoliorum TaxID=28548 RepID=A0A8H2W4V1_9HELO|nr:ecee6abb-f040-47fb-9009-fcd4558b0989 [Sclerotinia trifoliorum]